jgi:hypothetical protein
VAALARVKANDKALGSPSLHLAREASAAVVSAEADRFAATVLPFHQAGTEGRRDDESGFGSFFNC